MSLKINLFPYDIAENCLVGVKQQSLTHLNIYSFIKIMHNVFACIYSRHNNMQVNFSIHLYPYYTVL